MHRLTRHRTGQAFAPLLLVALALPPMIRQPLWYDEVATRDASRRSLAALWTLVHHTDGVFAGYYLLMHLVLRVGSAPWLLRLPSLLATVGTVVLAGRLGSRLLNERGGRYAGLLCAANPFVVTYAYDARPYALATLFVTGASAAVILPNREDRRSLRWSVWASLAVLAHLFAVLALLPQLRRLPRGGRLLLLAPFTLVVALGLVSLSQRNQLGWIHKPRWIELLSGWSTLSGGWWLAVPAALGLVAAVRLGGGWATVALWSVSPLLLLLLISVEDPVYLARYAIEGTPALALLIVLGLQRLGGLRWHTTKDAWRATVAVAPAFAVGVGVILIAIQGLRPFRYENIPAASDYIRDGSRRGDVLVYLGVSVRLALADQMANPIRPGSDDGPGPPDALLSTNNVLDRGTLEAASVGPRDVPALLSGPSRLWVVSWAGVDAIPGRDPTSQAVRAATTIVWKSLGQRSFGSLMVSLWTRSTG